MDKLAFINEYIKHFKSDKEEFEIVLKMGDNLKDQSRLEQVVRRFKEITEFVFLKKEIWVILILWDVGKQEFKTLRKLGFDETLAKKCYNGSSIDGILNFDFLPNDRIKYLNYSNYAFDDIAALVKAIGGYELGLEGRANILAYFLTFDEDPIFVNLYDDRGMEVICTTINSKNKIYEKFDKYVLK